MNEEKSAIRLMKGLETLFIEIRANPESADNKNMLKLFNDNLHNGMIFESKIIATIKKQLNNLEEFPLRPYIIGELDKVILKYNSFNIERVRISIGAIKHILKELNKKLENYEFDKARTMASAVHNFPSFLLNEYKSSPEEFWEGHICFYQRLWKENFMSEYENFFKQEYSAFDR